METTTAAVTTTLEVTAKDLHGVLKRLSPVIHPSPIVPITEFVFVDIFMGQATLTGYDLQNELSLTMPQQGEGRLLMPHAIMLALTKELGESALKIVSSQQGEQFFLNVTCEGKRYKIATESPTEFPKTPRMTVMFPNAPITIPTTTIKEAFTFLAPSLAHDDLRPSMCGVSFQIKEIGIEMVTTDGQCLSRFRLPVVWGVDGVILPTDTRNLNVIIPGSATNAIHSLRGKEITIALTNGHIRFMGEDCQYIGRLVDEKYPDYHKVIRQEGAVATTTFASPELSQAIKRIRLFSNSYTRHIGMDFKGGWVSVFAQDYDEGSEAKERLPTLSDDTGKSLSIGFNANLLAKALKQHPKTITMHTTAANKLILFTSDDERKLTLVMPVILNNHLQ